MYKNVNIFWYIQYGTHYVLHSALFGKLKLFQTHYLLISVRPVNLGMTAGAKSDFLAVGLIYIPSVCI